MREYVVLHVLRHHRNLSTVIEARNNNEWKQIIEPPAHERNIGVMGLGILGLDCAKAIKNLGFNVSGWSKSKKELNGIKTFTGKNNLKNFIQNIEILVCMLPLTNETRGILNMGLFSQMKKGACLINTARGGIINERDLCIALQEKLIAGAAIDVFEDEPYSGELVKHDNCILTAHMGSMTADCRARMEIEATEEVIRFLKGTALKGKVPEDEYEIQRKGFIT